MSYVLFYAYSNFHERSSSIKIYFYVYDNILRHAQLCYNRMLIE